MIRLSQEWAKDQPGHLGLVVGATRGEAIAEIRNLAPDAFLLVPGVGAQGGDLATVCKFGQNELGGLWVNSSRGVLFAGDGEDFFEASAKAAHDLQVQMKADL